MENQPLKPLLTPGQKAILKYGKIPDLISRFDLHPFSSPEAVINARAHNRIQAIIAPLSNSKPDLIDIAQFAPLSESGAQFIKTFERAIKTAKLPPGYCLNHLDQPIFDKNWKEKGLANKDLPTNHPDYAPF